MITAVFTDNDDYAHAYGLWQWDYGQQLRIEGLHLPTAVEIHFALQETGGEAITRVGTTKDGVTTVTIPDSMLEGNSTVWTADKAYNIYAWVYLSDKSSGETIKRITMQVKSRPKPEAFEAPGDGEIFHEAIEAVNDAAKRAEEAGDKAIAAADEAEKAATQTAEHLEAVQGLAEQVEINADTVAQDKQAVTGMLSQAQQAALDAALSAQAAKLSETAAGQAQTGAEAAEDGARQYAEETEVDRQSVAEDKRAVEEMVVQFGQAQETAVGAVKAEGDKQMQRIQDGVVDLAPAIHNTASGSVITADDTTEGRPFRGLRVFGRTDQVRTTGAQLLDESKVEQNNFRAFKYINLSVGEGSFTLSSNIPKSSTDSSAYIMLISGNVQETSSENTTVTNGVYKGQSRTFPSINGYVTIAYRNDANANNIINFNDYWYMLNKGAEEKPYEPYTGGKPSPSPKYPQEPEDAGKGGSVEVEVTGKNLIDIPEIKAGVGDNRVECHITKDVVFSCISENVEMEKDVWLVRLDLKDGTYYHINSSKMTLNPKFHATEDNPIIAYYYRCNYVTAGKYTNIQLEYGDTPTEYEPYTSQLLTLATPNGLPGVPVSKDGNYTDSNGQQWVCDEIDLERGKYVQRIETRIFDGTEAWKHSITNSGNNNFQLRINDRPSSTLHQSFCNYLPYKNFIWDDDIVNLPKIYSYSLEITASFPPESEFKFVEIWNSWLKEKGDFKFQYVLATPIERDLTPEEITVYKALRTYGPTTVVSNDAGAHMEVTYVADTKAYIQNLEQRLSAKLVNIQLALISQKISGGGAFNNSR